MHEYRTASILAFTETWLTGNDNIDSLHIDGHSFGSPVRLDRDTELTGKQHGGGASTSHAGAKQLLSEQNCAILKSNSLRSPCVPLTFPGKALNCFSLWFISTPEQMHPQPQPQNICLCLCI